MLEADPLTRIIAAVAAVGLIAAFIVRARQKDRRQFRRFRRYRSTAKRQQMMKRWLIESLVLFGLTGAAILIATRDYVEPLLVATQQLAPIASVRAWLGGGIGVALLAATLVALVILTVAGVRSARKEGGVIVVGDIAALLPRNRPELGWGAALSINAGVSEELLFRLALPALLVIVTGEPLSAFGLAALVFGLLHAYQGPVGVAVTTLVGLAFTAVYVLSGSILLVMALHALFDLRTLVIIPAAVYRVHEVPGTVRFPKPLPLAPRTIDEPADSAQPADSTHPADSAQPADGAAEADASDAPRASDDAAPAS
ncbi:CPBP family intramembrane glutamic endopeptidase [Microcella sp.]|uniref:CPBP family intramembrane glutamic endopeptidase n=1 Tax=Microcella sp. TaxID=1913979 RepID=UPI00391B30AD